MTIQAIETEYKGYKFRSRLEARWAVLLDSLELKWEYEKEGYELSTGERYLPDFYLPNEEMFVEVKGEEPSKDYMDKLMRFGKEIKKSILLVVGIANENKSYLLCKYESSEVVWQPVYIFESPVYKGQIIFGILERDSKFEDHFLTNINDEFNLKSFIFDKEPLREEQLFLGDIFEVMLERTRKNIDAMRQARFEFQNKVEKPKKSKKKKSNVITLPNSKPTKKMYQAFLVAERRILAHIIRDSDLAYRVQLIQKHVFNDYFNLDKMFNIDEHQAIFNYLMGYYEDGNQSDTSGFLCYLSDDKLKKIVAEIDMIPINSEVSNQEINDYISVILRYPISLKIKELSSKKMQAEKEKNYTEAQTIASKILELQKQLKRKIPMNN